MGYYGLGPGMNSRQPVALSALEQALRALPLDKWEATLELVEKLIRNAQRNPNEEKFRKIKLTNQKIAATITDVPGALELMREYGWTDAAEDGCAILVLPSTIRYDFQEHVVKIVEAKDWYKKAVEDEKRQQSRAARAMEDPQKKELMEQLARDRAKRSADEAFSSADVTDAMLGA